MKQSIVVARHLLDEFWDFQIPIAPEGFAEKLGLRIVQSDELGTKSGFFDADNRVIYVNKKDCMERQRFTIAHELGHFCLGHGSSMRDTSKEKWYEFNPEHEIAANQFAAELLMPAMAVKAMVTLRKVKDPVALRQAFGVSSQALSYRLKNLGYFL